MGKNLVSGQLLLTALLFSFALSAKSNQHKDTLLKSQIYSGKALTQSSAHFLDSNVGVASNEPAPDNFKNPYYATELPLLVGFPIEQVIRYIRSNGLYEIDPLTLSDASQDYFKVSDVPFEKLLAKRVTYNPEGSDDEIFDEESVGYYVHNGQLTTSNFIYHDAAIFNPQQTPYYKEVQQKFQKSKALIFEEKTSTVNQKDLDFYHFKRNDGYIESYGFYEIPPKYDMEAKVTLVFQALYPNTQKESLAKHATKLFKEHYHAVNQRYKKLSK